MTIKLHGSTGWPPVDWVWPPSSSTAWPSWAIAAWYHFLFHHNTEFHK